MSGHFLFIENDVAGLLVDLSSFMPRPPLRSLTLIHKIAFVESRNDKFGEKIKVPDVYIEVR